MARLEAKVTAISEHAHANVALYATIMPGQSADVTIHLIERGVVAFKISGFESSPTRFPRMQPTRPLICSKLLLRPTFLCGCTTKTRKSYAPASPARVNGRRGAASRPIRASRPLAAELASTAQFLELGAASGAHAHIVHLTSSRGFQLVDHY